MATGVYKRSPETLEKLRQWGATHGKHFTKGHKTNIGRKYSVEKKAKTSGSNNVNWKGDKVGYAALHDWVERHLGKPKRCEFCFTESAKKFEWANRSREYKREVDDWIRLCCSCHKIYDYNKITI